MTPVLSAEGLAFGYGREPVLRDVSLTVGRGELVGIIGPNGGGKTTLVRLLSGVARPQAGTVSLDGRPLASFRRREAARRIAVVSQDPRVDFPFTALEVVLMGRAPLRPVRSLPAARPRRVPPWAGSTSPGSSGARRQLSGGERRVLLARALAREPEVLLDEPTTHLDLATGSASTMVRMLGDRGVAVLSVPRLNLAALTAIACAVGGRTGRVRGRPAEVLTEAVLTAAYGRPCSSAG
jgi:iron complex transport system ATP-binding protein